MTAEINVFSVLVETLSVSDEADVMSSGRRFHGFGPAETNAHAGCRVGLNVADVDA